MYHTARRPENATVQGKRVGVIGNGSTGVQVITDIAKDAKHLISFQRNPQYSVPSGNGPATPEYRQRVNEIIRRFRERPKTRSFLALASLKTWIALLPVLPMRNGMLFLRKPGTRVEVRCPPQINVTTLTKSGFRFMFETFNDITTNVDANIATQDFTKNKIR